MDTLFSKYKNNITNDVNQMELFKLWTLSKCSQIINKNSIRNNETKDKDYESLQANYVLTPIDKATNNVAIICKRLYFQTMRKEILTNQSTYISSSKTENEIVTEHINVNKKFNIEVKNEDKKLPLIYAIPKLHKTPYKFRFISGAAHCSTKTLSTILLIILKKFKQHFRNYCQTIESRTNKKQYISIESSQNVIDGMNRNDIIPTNGASYDFSTLYTEFDLNEVQLQLSKLTDKCFSSACKKYLSVPYYKKSQAYYTNETLNTNNRMLLTAAEIKDLIHTVLTNSYVVYGNTIFHQVKGIPMGGNASPLIADLTLSMMEYTYLESHFIPKQAQLYRYVDDILAINMDFDQHKDQIYHNSLKLNKEIWSIMA